MSDNPIIEFDAIHFTESALGPPTVIGHDLMIPVSGLLVADDAPNMEPPQPLFGALIFKRVQRSIRKITEYIGDPSCPDGHRSPYFLEQEFGLSSEDMREYTFEGVQTDPAAWVDWTIWADSFELVGRLAS